jgi:hypothetical protein
MMPAEAPIELLMRERPSVSLRQGQSLEKECEDPSGCAVWGRLDAFESGCWTVDELFRQKYASLDLMRASGSSLVRLENEKAISEIARILKEYNARNRLLSSVPPEQIAFSKFCIYDKEIRICPKLDKEQSYRQ